MPACPSTNQIILGRPLAWRGKRFSTFFNPFPLGIQCYFTHIYDPDQQRVVPGHLKHFIRSSPFRLMACVWKAQLQTSLQPQLREQLEVSLSLSFLRSNHTLLVPSLSFTARSSSKRPLCAKGLYRVLYAPRYHYQQYRYQSGTIFQQHINYKLSLHLKYYLRTFFQQKGRGSDSFRLYQLLARCPTRITGPTTFNPNSSSLHSEKVIEKLCSTAVSSSPCSVLRESSLFQISGHLPACFTLLSSGSSVISLSTSSLRISFNLPIQASYWFKAVICKSFSK